MRRFSPPTLLWFKDAGAFTVRGHRLSNLYREERKTLSVLTVLKILKSSAQVLGAASEYLRNSEGADYSNA